MGEVKQLTAKHLQILCRIWLEEQEKKTEVKTDGVDMRMCADTDDCMPERDFKFDLSDGNGSLRSVPVLRPHG